MHMCDIVNCVHSRELITIDAGLDFAITHISHSLEPSILGSNIQQVNGVDISL